MWLLLVVQDKANPLNLSQLLWYSLGITTGSHHQGVRIPIMCQPEEVARFTVSNMSNRASI